MLAGQFQSAFRSNSKAAGQCKTDGFALSPPTIPSRRTVKGSNQWASHATPSPTRELSAGPVTDKAAYWLSAPEPSPPPITQSHFAPIIQTKKPAQEFHSHHLKLPTLRRNGTEAPAFSSGLAPENKQREAASRVSFVQRALHTKPFKNSHVSQTPQTEAAPWPCDVPTDLRYSG